MTELTIDDWKALIAIPDDDYTILRGNVIHEGVATDLDAIDAEVLRRWRQRCQEESDGPTPTV